MALSKEGILSATDGGLDIFKKYITGFPGVGKAFLNPFYDDTKPSAYVYRQKDCGNYSFVDHGNLDYIGDCFSFVGWIFNKNTADREDFIDVMEIINRELGLGLSSNKDKVRELTNRYPNTIKKASEVDPLTISENREEVSKRYLEPQYKAFTPDEQMYWLMYGVNMDTLKKYNVRSVKTFRGVTKEDKEYSLESTDSAPIFAYPGSGYVKIYRPYSNSKDRFRYSGNLHEGYTFGIEQLPQRGDLLFITGGEKDVLSLAAHGFNAICFNSETANIPKKIIRRFSFRFKHIVLLYDMDQTGIKSMNTMRERLKEFDVKSLALPLSGAKDQKDISDFFRLGNTAKDLNKIFTDMLDRLYDETMSMLKSFELDYANPPKPAEPIISINDVPIGTEGNIMAITGSEGSGKSNYLGALLAGTMLDEFEDIDLLGAEVVPNLDGRAVLFYDTEQSEEQLYKNMKRILKRADAETPPEWFKTYGLVGMDRKDRLTSILQSMDKFYYEMGGIHMVIIDGIADLMTGVNDEDSAVGLIDELFRLAGIYKTCIVGVLHLSPSGYKLRGHLGSEVQRKAAGIISIEKDDDPQYSVVKPLKVREGSPLDVPQYIMGWDKELKAHITKGEKHGDSPSVRRQNEIISIAKSAFTENQSIAYKDLVKEFTDVLPVQERTARKYIKTLRDAKIISTSSGETGIYRLVEA
jgi:hypothetical protein